MQSQPKLIECNKVILKCLWKCKVLRTVKTLSKKKKVANIFLDIKQIPRRTSNSSINSPGGRSLSGMLIQQVCLHSSSLTSFRSLYQWHLRRHLSSFPCIKQHYPILLVTFPPIPYFHSIHYFKVCVYVLFMSLA